MKIKNVILDIGNVLVDFCWASYFQSFHFSEEVFKKVAAATVMSEGWNELDRGNLTEEELLTLFVENDPSVEKEIQMVFKDISGTIEPFDYAMDWILRLKEQGLSVYILSNFSEKAYKECGDKLNFIQEADGAVLSFEDKVIKPEDTIYQILLQRFALKPEECVFFDDREENIAGAKRNGIHGIVFKNLVQAEEELRKLME